MSDQGRYAYGVIESSSLDAEELDLEVTAVGGETTTVETVSHGPLAAVVSDIDDVEPPDSEENVQAHDEVLRTVMEHGDGRAIVPMQFGMAFENERALKNVLRSGRRAFTKALREIDGAHEVGVKVLAPEDEQPAVDVEAEIADPLAAISRGEAQNDLFSDRLLLNRSYLVDHDDRDAFDEEIDRLREAHPDLQIQYTGPWAPYNFVDIEIGATH